MKVWVWYEICYKVWKTINFPAVRVCEIRDTEQYGGGIKVM